MNKKIIIELITPKGDLRTDTLEGKSVGTRLDDTYPGFIIFYADHVTQYVPLVHLHTFTMVLPSQN